MKPKAFWTFATVTGITLVAAVVAVMTLRPQSTTLRSDEPAVAGLAEKINDVASIKIKSAEAEFAIGKSGDAWGVVEKGGYTVPFDSVKTALVAISDFKLVDAKTSDPERYARLELREPGSKDAKSTRVTLQDKDGKAIATLIVGKRAPDLFGESGGGTYIRRGDEAQTWLVKGTVDIGPNPNAWMAREIVNVTAEQVKHWTIRHPDGEVVTIVNDGTDKKPDFKVLDMPAGRALRSDSAARDVAGGIWRLSFEDVKPLKDAAFPKEFSVTKFETFDGLEVKVEVAMIDSSRWGKFSASVADRVTDPEAKKKVEEAAAEINKRATGWLYKLSPGEGETLTTKMQDLLAKPKDS